MLKSLITINTCNRLKEVKKNILPYLQFCNANNNFDFMLALDGNDNDYISFCKENDIPLLYSEKQEGVGLSKNRVLKQFPNYDYYFFIDDDIELINPIIFERFIKISIKTKFHHLSYSVNDKINKIENKYFNLIGGYRGGGCFNFYTKKALDTVGGWHTNFAKYKRFGHTEHSYRIYYKELNPYPYITLNNIHKYLFLNDPPHVTKIEVEINENELILEEQDMINAKQTYFALATISDFNFNGKDVSIPKLNTEMQKGRYSLLKIKDKLKAWGSFCFHKFTITKNPFFLLIALVLFPNNSLLKHWIKNLVYHAK